MDRQILKYIPESKRPAIRDCFRDDDGLWIFLNAGWNADRTDSCCRVIHEDTIAGIRWQIAGIRRVES